MAKQLKSKLILDISPWRQGLDEADRRFRTTIAQMERESKRSITAIRGDMLGGIGTQGNQSMQEMRAFLQEQKAAARTAKESFDAQIGGGMFSATQSKFNPALDGAKAGFADLLAKAWAAKTAIHEAFTVGSAAVNVFKGNIDKAKEALASLPMTGWANQMGNDAGEWLSDWASEHKTIATVVNPFFTPDTGSYKERAEQLKDAEAQSQRNKQVAERNRKTAEFAAETDRMWTESGMIGASDYQKSMMRINQFRETENRKLSTSGIGKDTPQYAARQRAITEQISKMQWEADKEETDRQDKALADKQSAADAAAKAAEEAANREADAKRKHANEVASVDASISIKRLQLQGKTLSAELRQIDEAYREKIAKAKEAGDAELAKKYETERDLEKIAAAREANTGEARPGSAAQINRAYSVIGSVSTNGTPPPQPIKADPEELALLQRIAEKLGVGIIARAA